MIRTALEAMAHCDLCPICGEHITIIGETKNGRLIGSCHDAFTQKQWDAPEDDYENC